MSDSPGRREVAHRVFAAEYDAATLEYSESDEERAPNYVLTPTGARVNRLFFVGVLTEVESVSDDVLRARIADPTGAFVVYAGQYQPEAVAFFESTDPPAFVAVTGKARTFSPEDSDRVFSSVRPESVNVVDAETRDRWVVGAAEQTLARVATFAAAIDLDATGDDLRSTLSAAGVDESLAAGIPVALDHYGTTENYLAATADLAREALRLVAGETDEVDVPGVDPDDPGGGAVDSRRLAAGVPRAVVDFEAPAESAAEGRPTTGPAEEGAEATAETNGTDAAAEAASADAATGTADDGIDERATTAGTGGDATADGEGSSDGDAFDDTGVDESAGAAGTAETEAIGDFESDGVDDAADEVGDFEPGGGLADDAPADDGETADGTAAAGDAEVPEDVLDDEERERIEEEYGTEFSTGTEVDDPGEAGIEPEAGDVEPAAGDVEPSAESGGEAGTTGAGESAGTAEETSVAAGEATDAEGPGERAAASAGETADADGAAGADAADGEAAAEATEADAAEAGDAAEDVTADESTAGEPADLEAALLERMADLDDGDGADREALIESLVEEFGVVEADVEDAIDDALMGGKCYEPADGKLKPI